MSDFPDSKGVKKILKWGDKKYGDENFTCADIETLTGPDDHEDGWGAKESFGVAVLSEYDSIRGEIISYKEEECDEYIGKIPSYDRLIGHNFIDFDMAVLRGEGADPDDLNEPEVVDIFEYIKDKTGEWVGLDDLAKKNLGIEKTMDGKHAPELWQKGKKQKVIDYCESDVKITLALYFLGKYHGHLLLPDESQHKGYLSVKTDW